MRTGDIVACAAEVMIVMTEQTVPQSERDRLKYLAEEVARIAADPRHRETIQGWKNVNDLRGGRPMVWVYQIPWREMRMFGEEGPQCQHEMARGIESSLQEIIYRWRHMPVDMVVERERTCGYVLHSTGIGVEVQVDRLPHDSAGGVDAQHFTPVITSEADVEKIRTPELTCDWEATEANELLMKELIGDILPVVRRGRTHHSYSPWDRLTGLMGPQNILLDLAIRPEFVHAVIDRLTQALVHELDQLVEQNLLSLPTGNMIVGQGGLGFTDDLPLPDCDPGHVRLQDQWGETRAQIFSEVSPDMHEEFSLAYEKRLLDRFGLCYYGCCEPLDRKVGILEKHIPNLRKISMSPWIKPDRAAEAIAGRFVFSFKPNPAFLATDGQWDRRSAEAQLRHVLEVTRGQPVEIILKDISTVRFEPQRLWEWCAMAMELAQEYTV
jgi:hypothetical protein